MTRLLTVLRLAAIGAAALLFAPAASRADEPEPDALDWLADARALTRDLADHSIGPLLRDWLEADEDPSRYGLRLDENWQDVAARSPELPLVVFIHGFNSTPARSAALLTPIRRAGFPCAVFAYPNDWSLTDSATFLSRELNAFTTANPAINIALVTHSMGGLVARACVEDDSLDAAAVTRLVMIAPPTHGSLLAYASFGADFWEHGLARPDGGFVARWRDSVLDGLGEATADLTPGSEFLHRLNARRRNPRVRYAIFLGTHAAVSPGEFELLRTLLARTTRREGLGQYASTLDEFLAELDELVEGKGDGAVAVKRGRLEGVDDVVELPFNHFSCTDEPRDDAVRRLQSELLARLR